MNLFLRFQQVGVTVLIATHDIALIERMGHRRLILDHGELHCSELQARKSDSSHVLGDDHG
jgi:cell division transport system ATP-binding protein